MSMFSEDVKLELVEMKKIGMRVPAKAIKHAENEKNLEEYDNMKVSECADLIIQLADGGCL